MLRARRLSWPLSIDADGITLRYRGKVPWESNEKSAHGATISMATSRGSTFTPLWHRQDPDSPPVLMHLAGEGAFLQGLRLW